MSVVFPPEKPALPPDFFPVRYDHSHYLKRVVPEHRKPKFLKWMAATIDTADGIVRLLDTYDREFDIYTATGKQQDILGDIVGRQRLLNFQPPLGLSPILDDDLYRILQRAKISINQWDGTIASVYELWNSLFPEYHFVLRDNQDMSMDFFVAGDTNVMERELMSRGYIAPKPEGVRINYDFILPKIELDKTIYTGGLIVGDSADIGIALKALEDMLVLGRLYTGGAITADAAYMSIPIKALNEMAFQRAIYVASVLQSDLLHMDIPTKLPMNVPEEFEAKQEYAVGWWDISYIAIPTVFTGKLCYA